MNWAHFCSRCEFNLDCDTMCTDAVKHRHKWWVRLLEWWQNIWFEFKWYWSGNDQTYWRK